MIHHIEHKYVHTHREAKARMHAGSDTAPLRLEPAAGLHLYVHPQTLGGTPPQQPSRFCPIGEKITRC